jgi:hypothetical protein
VLRASLDEMLRDCPLVFEGVVVDAWSVSSPSGVHTWLRFRVDETLKGTASEALALRFRGGRIGDVVEEVAGSPIPQVGERGIFFVESVERFLVNPLYGWDQGQVRILRGADGSDRVHTSQGHPIVAVEDAATVSARAAQPTGGTAFSTGVAAGIRADARAHADQALRAEDFKAALAARLERVR